MSPNTKITQIKTVKKPKWNEDVPRLILYADFMGFKSRVYSTEHATIKSLLENFIDAFHRRLQPLQMGGNLKFVQFSDSILVVVNGTDFKMFNLITKAAICMMQEALRIKFGIKGVLAQGVFSFDDSKDLYFGRPLVDAYELHEQIKYYGVVVHHSAENTVKNNMSESNPYSKSDIFIDKGPVAHYHLCWNLVDTKLAPKDITSLCNSWLDSIEETVSGNPRQYIDKTRAIITKDSKDNKTKKQDSQDEKEKI